ncbi:Rv0361 family membrane protein [Nocardia rhizosphaerae]|uniref:Mce-associated membrane protein n=1 Tax=Nocardia rhizosphaerae TaxID=1691571 RepID=A0ABV8KZ66_9NOCA
MGLPGGEREEAADSARQGATRGEGSGDPGVEDAENAAMATSGRDASSERDGIPDSDAPTAAAPARDAEHRGAGQTVPTASKTGHVDAGDAGTPMSGANREQDGIAGSDAPTVAGAVVGQPVSRAPEEGATEEFVTGPGAETQAGPGASTDSGRNSAGESGRPAERPGAAAAAASAAGTTAAAGTASPAGPTTPAGPGAAGPGAAGSAASPHKADIPPSEDQTVAMRVVNPADAPTTAMPIQRMTDRVVPPAGGRPMTPPPSTPRGPAGPRQAGNQGGPHGHGGEETQPPRGPGAVPKQASAPSPADIQPTRPAEQLADGRRQIAPPNEPGPLAHGTEQAQPGGRPVAQPRRIEAPQAAPAEAAPGRSKKWLFAVGGAAVLVLALIAGVVWMTGGDNSPEGQVKAAIGTYTDALRSGDLDGLRASTCGELHDFYQGITPEQFSGVHQLSAEQGSIPVVDSVDAVRITDDTALAEATVSTSADPSTRTARTFDLQRTEDGWKVCDPTATP